MLGANWELMGDITWTGWSSVQQLQIIRTSATVAPAVWWPSGLDA